MKTVATLADKLEPPQLVDTELDPALEAEEGAAAAAVAAGGGSGTRIATVFDSFAHRGLLSPDEFREAIRRETPTGGGIRRTEVTNRELAEIFRVTDYDHNGVVHTEELMALIWGGGEGEGEEARSMEDRVRALLHLSEGGSHADLDLSLSSSLGSVAAEEGVPPAAGSSSSSSSSRFHSPTRTASTSPSPRQLSQRSPQRDGAYGDAKQKPQLKKKPRKKKTAAATGPGRRSNAKSGGGGGGGQLSPADLPKLVIPDKKARRALFNRIDVNGNGGLSLAEIDKAVVEGVLGRALGVPGFNHKPALMRAYMAADTSGDSFIGRAEFAKLLRYIVYFNNLWEKFEEIDSDHDRRLSADEFAAGCEILGLGLSAEEALAEFEACDTDGGGMVLFGEFCMWCAEREHSAKLQQQQQQQQQQQREGGGSARSPPRQRQEQQQQVADDEHSAGAQSPQSPSQAVLLSALGAKLGYDAAGLDLFVEEQHSGDLSAALTALRGLMAVQAKAKAAAAQAKA
jgi:Ca2+-binding EF-hand superfamily protein